MTKNVTIKDIAREAGVSIALVSFVMNNRIEANGKKRYRVSESTKQKILEVAKRMNYRPSSAARMLRKGRTHVIGILLSDLANIFYGILAKEFERICYQNGYTVLFGSMPQDITDGVKQNDRKMRRIRSLRDDAVVTPGAGLS